MLGTLLFVSRLSVEFIILCRRKSKRETGLKHQSSKLSTADYGFCILGFVLLQPGYFPTRNSSRLPLGKLAATERCYPAWRNPYRWGYVCPVLPVRRFVRCRGIASLSRAFTCRSGKRAHTQLVRERSSPTRSLSYSGLILVIKNGTGTRELISTYNNNKKWRGEGCGGTQQQ